MSEKIKIPKKEKKMEIKVGQWVRGLQNNEFAMITKVFKIDEKQLYFAYNNTEIQIVNSALEKYFKVADTPQELVMIGDLVYYQRPTGLNGKRHNLIVSSYEGQYETESHDYIRAEKIIKLFTPNSNGGYDLQWPK